MQLWLLFVYSDKLIFKLCLLVQIQVTSWKYVYSMSRTSLLTFTDRGQETLVVKSSTEYIV